MKVSSHRFNKAAKRSKMFVVGIVQRQYNLKFLLFRLIFLNNQVQNNPFNETELK